MKRETEVRICECGCGKRFTVVKMSGRWFASNACKQRAYRARQARATKLTPIELVRVCPVCGKQFMAIATRQVFDCTKCRVKAYDRRQSQLKKEGINALS